MPSKSKAQLHLMQMALAYKTGKISDVNVSQKIKDVADSMTVKQLKDFLEVESEKLPNKIEEDDGGGDFGTSAPIGMGNVQLPTATETGSGDRFDNVLGLYTSAFLKKAKKDRKSKKSDPMKYYKPKKGKAITRKEGTMLYFSDFIKGASKTVFTDRNDTNDNFTIDPVSDSWEED
jgi:hypothetical protein